MLTHQVLWFQVSVHDSKTVHVVECEAQLVNNACRLLLAEFLLCFDHIEKISTGNQLHNDVKVSAIFH